MNRSTMSALARAFLRPQNTERKAKRGAVLSAIVLATVGVLSAGNAARADQDRIECFVYDDGYTNVAGPSDAVYFAGPQKACIPDGTATGTCRKWFGGCRTVARQTPIKFAVFNDGNSSIAGYQDSVYVAGSERACLPDGTASGTCRRWFGLGGDSSGGSVSCQLFNDGYSSATSYTNAILFRSNGLVCQPDGTATGTCRKWFGRCILVPQLL